MWQKIKDVIKSILRNNPITQKKFSKWEKERTAIAIEKRNNLLHANGYTLISDLQLVLSKSNIQFFWDAGTLLGIIREGRIISYDMDIDLGINIKNEATINSIRTCLTENGCTFVSENIVENFGIVQDTFKKYGVEFDVYYYYPEGEHDITYFLYRKPQKQYKSNLWDVVKVTNKPVCNTIMYPFKNFYVSVPELYEEHLANRYGINWGTPDENYIYWEGVSTIPIENKGFMNKK